MGHLLTTRKEISFWRLQKGTVRKQYEDSMKVIALFLCLSLVACTGVCYSNVNPDGTVDVKTDGSGYSVNL